MKSQISGSNFKSLTIGSVLILSAIPNNSSKSQIKKQIPNFHFHISQNSKI